MGKYEKSQGCLKSKESILNKAKQTSKFDSNDSIFLTAFGLASLAIFLTIFWRNRSTLETWDRKIFLSAVVVVLGYMLLLKMGLKRIFWSAWLIPISASFIYGTVAYEVHGPAILSQLYWLGFGFWVFSGTLVAAIFYWPIVSPVSHSKKLNRSVKVAAVVIVFLTALSFLQFGSTLIDPNSSLYNLNEMMSLHSGNWPYINFVPQYGGIWMYILAIFPGVDSANLLIQIGLIGMYLISILAFYIAIYLVVRMQSKRNWAAAILLVVPLISVTQVPVRTGYFGSIAALLSAFPVRIITGSMVLFLVLNILDKIYEGKKVLKSELIGFGLFLGNIFWVSQDFGVAAAIVAIFALFFLPKKINQQQRIPQIIIATSFFVGLLVYPVGALFFGKRLDFRYLFFFERQFGAGFGAESIKFPGPILVVLPLFLALFAYHSYSVMDLWKNTNTQENNLAIRTANTGLVFAAWGLIDFLYYLNRSWASGQLQILLYPLSISLAAFAINYARFNHIKGNRKPFKKIARSRMHLTITIICSLSFGAIVAQPDPRVEIARLRSNQTQAWFTPALQWTSKDVVKARKFANSQRLSLGYYGNFGNLIQQMTGVDSINILNAATDYGISSSTAKLTCEYLNDKKKQLIVISDEALGILNPKDNSLCGDYMVLEVPGIRLNHLFKRIN